MYFSIKLFTALKTYTINFYPLRSCDHPTFYTHAHTHIYIYVCACIYIYTHTHTHTVGTARTNVIGSRTSFVIAYNEIHVFRGKHIQAHSLDQSYHPTQPSGPLKTDLNAICHLLALLGVHHNFHVSGLRVKREKYN